MHARHAFRSKRSNIFLFSVLTFSNNLIELTVDVVTEFYQVTICY